MRTAFMTTLAGVARPGTLFTFRPHASDIVRHELEHDVETVRDQWLPRTAWQSKRLVLRK
ncbi:MAG: hypothetical protein CME32_25785 [Gimesia sp.]|nr:hypothetical protein [Gimesia sp.]